MDALNSSIPVAAPATRGPRLLTSLWPPLSGHVMEAWARVTPMRRMAEVSDLQGAVVYLASEASDYMTGADMLIDGGYCAW